MRFRPLAVLCRLWLALLLLAGAPALTGSPDRAWAATPAAGQSEYQAGGLQKRLPHKDQGRAAALDPAWTDADDDAKALLFAPASAAAVEGRTSRVSIGGTGRNIPLSHWPCAGTPTGPPRS
jgi:hypothetical protein